MIHATQETSMRKSLILAASLGTMLISSAAFAASMNAAGVIKSIDAKANTITLADGKSYVLPAKFDIKSLKTGEKVTVTYDMKGKEMVATGVKAG
jgi:Cu/Ag efflux protein CusF